MVKEEFIHSYDMIVNINSLENLAQGWNIKYSQDGYKRYLEQKDKESCVVGIVGNGNAGKCFILQKIDGVNLPLESCVSIEGLSVKYPVDLYKKIILLDTGGLDTLILVKDIGDQIKDINYKPNDAPSFNEEKVSNSKLESIVRDQQLTKQFLHNFVITHSNILIIVFNQLTCSDQKLLDKVKKDSRKRNQQIFVVHNLKSLVTKEEVETYINKVLLRSCTFSLSPLHMNNNNGDLYCDKTQNNIFYIEKRDNKSNITHLIMANNNSEAGKYYNQKTIELLRTNCDVFSDIDKFPVLEKLREHLFIVTKDLLEEQIASIEEIEIDNEKQIIKLKNRNEIVL